MHDEIGSTLSSISLFGVVAQKKLTQDDAMASRMLTRINESTTQMIEAMNDIVWAINADNDKMEHLINRMRAYSSELMEATEWRSAHDAYCCL